MIANTRELKTEFNKLTTQLNLDVHCLMDGPFQAEVAFIAEYPGEREKETGRPFSGGAGSILWKPANRLGFNRTNVYQTNIIKRTLRRIHYDGMADARENISKWEVDKWGELLRWELEQLPNLKYILCMGGPALKALTHTLNDGKDYSKITNWRGSVIHTRVGNREVTLVAAFNPGYINQEPRWTPVFNFDVARFADVVRSKFVPYEIKFHINPSFNEAMQWLDKMQDEDTPIGSDIETPNVEVGCIGFANDPHEGMCINFRTRTENVFSTSEERELRKRIQRLYADGEVRLVFQNAIFDRSFLWYKDRIRIPHVWYDTMLAHHVCYGANLPHSQEFMTSQYTTHPYYKAEKEAWKEGRNIDEYWEYNVRDCCIMLEIQQRTLAELELFGLDRFFFDHVMRAQDHIIPMNVIGVLCDEPYKEYVNELLKRDIEKMKSEFQDVMRKLLNDPEAEINPDSPKQLREAWFDKLGLAGRGKSTDKANKLRIEQSPRTPKECRQMIRLHTAYKEDKKFQGTYSNATLDPDGRYRTEYKQSGVGKAPGRLSSAKTSWNTGGNAQNQPHRAYPMFVADKGYQFGYFDGEQAEARLVAWYAPIPTWQEQFERARREHNYDCHRALAADLFEMPYDEVPIKDFDELNRPTRRYVAKRCRHGLNYRMMAPRLAEVLRCTLVEAERHWYKYHRITPELKQWWDWTLKEIQLFREIRTCYGRRLLILSRMDDKLFDSIVAFRPQSTLGDHVVSVMYRAQEDDRWPMGKARICLNIHDALVCITTEKYMKTCLQIMKEAHEVPLNIKPNIMNFPNLIEDFKRKHDGKLSREVYDLVPDQEPLIIPADVKSTNRGTSWRILDNGEVEFYDDDQGYHRWSDLAPVEDLEIAA